MNVSFRFCIWRLVCDRAPKRSARSISQDRDKHQQIAKAFIRFSPLNPSHKAYCTEGNSYTHFSFIFGINWRLHLHRGRLEIINECNKLHRGRLEIINNLMSYTACPLSYALLFLFLIVSLFCLGVRLSVCFPVCLVPQPVSLSAAWCLCLSLSVFLCLQVCMSQWMVLCSCRLYCWKVFQISSLYQTQEQMVQPGE